MAKKLPSRKAKLPSRKIIVGCDEKCVEVRITDQKTLRWIKRVLKLIPAR